MLPNTTAWQKWPLFVATLVVGWIICDMVVFPSIGVAQDKQQSLDLTGVFTVSISQRDIPEDLAGGPSLAGIWSIDFAQSGGFTLTRLDVGQVASGAYEAGDTTVTFNEWHGLIGCAIGGTGARATYSWRRSDSALTLTPIRDACDERLTLLATRALGSDEACAGRVGSAPVPANGAAGDTMVPGTPNAENSPAGGVTAQEGLSDIAKAEAAVDGLLGQANGCWATGDPQSFLALHSDAVIQQLVFTSPPDVIVSRLRQNMMSPASFERIGDVNLSDSDHAWAYVQFTYDDEPQPVRVDFINAHGNWLFDTFIPIALSPPTPTLGILP